MVEAAREYGGMDHRRAAFVFVILSHGGSNDVVYGSDSEAVRVSALEEYFKPRNCPSLAGVPKIFIIDACRGNEDEDFHDMSLETKSVPTCRVNDTIHMSRVPDSADIALVFASSPEKVAYCHSQYGSDLTQNLKLAIDEAKKDDDFHKIINKVKRSCKQQCVEVHDRLTKKYYIKRNTTISKAQNCCREFKKTIEEWLTMRNKTINIVEEIMENLVKHRRNVNIAQITGGAAAVGGGVMAIVGFALIPVTFGASLAIGIGGVALGAAGGVTAAGAGITDVFIQKNGIADAKQHYEKDQKKLEEVIELAEKAEKCINETIQKCGNVNAKLAGQFFEATMNVAYRSTNVGLKVAEISVGGFFEVGALAVRIGGVAVRGVAIAGIAVNALLIPLDIVEIVRAAVNMKDGNENDSVKKLREFLRDLKYQKEKIEGKLNK